MGMGGFLEGNNCISKLIFIVVDCTAFYFFWEFNRFHQRCVLPWRLCKHRLYYHRAPIKIELISDDIIEIYF